MNVEILKKLIAKHSKPELAEQPGMVRQVWEDGEITCQKCGELLWRRSLHCFNAGVPEKAVPIGLFPHNYGNHGYIFSDEVGCKAVRDEILS